MENSEIKTRLEGIMARHNMSREQLAKYLGVPPTTLNNWLNGSRTNMNAATMRLLYVLGVLEVLAPNIHEQFIER